MINQISIWQMVVDLCLVTSILVMAFRSIKTSRVQAILPRALEIEAALRRAMMEAETTGRHVNDQLLRREQNIHKYVSDLDRHEKDLSLSIAEAESLAKELSLSCETARREGKELQTSLIEAESLSKSLSQARSTRPTASEIAEIDEQEIARRAAPVPARHIGKSAKRSEMSFSTKQKSPRANEWLDDQYEELDEEEAVEERAQSKVGGLKEVYDRAESMIKQGKELDAIARATKLPVEGVKRLAQMIEIEREEERERERTAPRKRQADPRLGALGATRR
jgi:hypothetical protein